VNLLVARGLLEPYGLRVDTAESGPEALEKIRREDPPYDIVFMDHMMPGMDGVETTARVREWERSRASLRGTGSSPEIPEIPLIALTANALSGMREQFLAQGFNGYISKPVDPDQLDEVLHRWIREKGDPPAGGEGRRPEAPAGGGGPGALSEPGEPPSLGPIPGVRVETGIALTGGRLEGYRLVLAAFRKDVQDRLPFLRTLAAPETLPGDGDADLRAFTTQVHALKSASASIGAEEVSAQAASLEAAGRAGDWGAIREGLPGFVQTLAALTGGIARVLGGEGETGERGAPPPDQALQGIASMVEALVFALEAQRAEETDRLLEELLGQFLDPKIRELLEAVSDRVLMAEYQEGAVLARGLLKSEEKVSEPKEGY
jgi:CheY-like chemotaxis protein